MNFSGSLIIINYRYLSSLSQALSYISLPFSMASRPISSALPYISRLLCSRLTLRS